MADDDDTRDAPPVVTASVAAGVAPTPFLAVYAVLFLAHGFIHPVQPPDITSTQGGEKVAGIITVVLLVAMVVTLFWFINGRRRWPFVLAQLATLVASVDFVFDSTTGSAAVPVVLALTSATALVLALLPASGEYVATRLWLPRRRTASSKAHELHREVPYLPQAERSGSTQPNLENDLDGDLDSDRGNA